MNLAELDAQAKLERKEETKTEPQVYKTYEDFDYEKLLTYAGIDNIATNTLLSKIWPQLIEEPVHYIVGPDGEKLETFAKSLFDVNADIGKLTMEYILDLEINGLKYDIEKNRAISKRMLEEVADLDAKIFKATGKTINFDSGKEVAEFLYKELKLEPPSLTKSGEPSTDGDALLMLAGLDPLNPGKYVTPDPDKQFLAWMAKRKDINSTHNTFVKSYIKDFVKRDGRIHPSYNLHGTSSFRITGDTPNLTQLPRAKHGYNVRECYGVEEGNFFLAADFSSAEVKVLAALCRDPGMIRACREGLDFHSFSAASMMGMSYEEFVAILNSDDPRKKEFKNRRQIAKIL